MEHRYVGRSGLRVSRLGLGTMTWGAGTDEDEAAGQVRALLEAGGCLVDVGIGYGGLPTEELLGAFLDREMPREELVISVRADVPGYRTGPDVSRRSLLAALDRSLAWLGTDHLDLWIIPGWSSRVPLEETLSALEAAVTSGRVRYTGMTNVAAWQVALSAVGGTARALPRAAGGVPVLVQAEYSLLNRLPEHELLPAAGHLGLGLLASSPLGRGVLTGKYRTGTPGDSRAASTLMASFVEPYLDRASGRIVDAVATAAEGLGCSALEVALAWVRDRPGVSSLLLGARTLTQFKAALGTEQTVLPEQIRTALDEASEDAA